MPSPTSVTECIRRLGYFLALKIEESMGSYWGDKRPIPALDERGYFRSHEMDVGACKKYPDAGRVAARVLRRSSRCLFRGKKKCVSRTLSRPKKPFPADFFFLLVGQHRNSHQWELGRNWYRTPVSARMVACSRNSRTGCGSCLRG